MLNDLAEAMKALDGKKASLPVWFSLLPLLPSLASSLSFSVGLRLPSSPRAPFVRLAAFCSVLWYGSPPCWLGRFLCLFGASLCCLFLSALPVLRFFRGRLRLTFVC